MAGSAEKIFVALDTPDINKAEALAKTLKGRIGGLKLGLEFYSALGRAGVERISSLGLPIFLDLKFHDIPNTVAGAVRALSGLKIKMLTVHTTGGVQMMRAAKEAAAQLGTPPPLVLGVTVLTSLDDNGLKTIGVLTGSSDQVLTLAGLAQGAGLDGIVCSPREIEKVRKKCGPNLTLMVPGIRPEGAEAGDQKRVLTPKQAVSLGADFLVIGRPITAAPDPAGAARAIADSLAGD